MPAKIVQSEGYFVVLFKGVPVFKTDVLGIARTVRDKYNRKIWTPDPDPDPDPDPECSTWNIQDLSTSYPQDFPSYPQSYPQRSSRVYARMCMRAYACVHIRTCVCVCVCVYVHVYVY